MGIASKLLTADRQAKSRLHDEKGNFVGWRKALLHGAPAICSGVLRVVFAYRPKAPWLAYDAIQYFDEFLTAQSRVLEFGSGMSTLWYAKRAGAVVSVEDYKPWYEKVTKLLADNAARGVDYKFRADRESYGRPSEPDQEGFDLIIVDGSHRDLCAETSIKLVKPGGIIYLDNSDRAAVTGQSAMLAAERALRTFAKEVGAEIIEITDFAPTQFFVNQGLLIRVPS